MGWVPCGNKPCYDACNQYSYMYISLIAGQAEMEWRCPMCSDDTSVIFQPWDASIPDDDPTLPAVEITRHDSPAKKRPAAFDEVPPKHFQRLLPTSTPTSSQLDITYIITDRRMIDTADAASHTVDQSSDRPVFDLGFSGLSSNNQSAPDTSQLVDTSITAAAATQHFARCPPTTSRLLTSVTLVKSASPLLQFPDKPRNRTFHVCRCPLKWKFPTCLLLTFCLVPAASCRLKPKLVDSHNHTYNVKAKLKSGVKWQCSVRNKDTYYSATVKQSGDIFMMGPQAHLRPPPSQLQKHDHRLPVNLSPIPSSLHHPLSIRLF